MKQILCLVFISLLMLTNVAPENIPFVGISLAESSSVILEKGSKGEAVVELQKYLNKRIYIISYTN